MAGAWSLNTSFRLRSYGRERRTRIGGGSAHNSPGPASAPKRRLRQRSGKAVPRPICSSLPSPIGSSLSQNTHFNSVRPLKLGAGTILFPQRKQRHSVHGNLPNLLLNHLETLVPT